MRWRQWYEWMPRRWRTEVEIASRYMDDVRSGTNWLGEAMISGTYRLTDRYGHVRDSYALRIVYPEDFLAVLPTVENPWCFPAHPRVFIDSHRETWVRCADAHIFDQWQLCLYVPGESSIDVRMPDALEKVFESIATYLIKQRCFQRDLRREVAGGPKAVWPGPDRGHLVAGLWQAVRAVGGLHESDQCICGRRRPYGKCCRLAIEAFAAEQVESAVRIAG